MKLLQLKNQWRLRLSQFVGIVGLTALTTVASGANVNIKPQQPSSGIPQVSKACSEKEGDNSCASKDQIKEKPKKFTYMHK